MNKNLSTKYATIVDKESITMTIERIKREKFVKTPFSFHVMESSNFPSASTRYIVNIIMKYG
jgi:protein-L-isoaspartate O-methyltransferase